MIKSKYKNIKKTCDGYTFDSSIEMKYYEKLKEDKAKGLIQNFELQPSFIIQDKFQDRNNKKYREIIYKADFQVYYTDKYSEVIDIKGMATPEAKLKRKMFAYRYVQVLKWLVWHKGLWRDYDEVQKERLLRKKAKTND